jgi:hypothetical protein
MKYGSFAKHFGRVLVGQEEERGIVTNADGATGGCFEKPSALCNVAMGPQTALTLETKPAHGNYDGYSFSISAWAGRG